MADFTPPGSTEIIPNSEIRMVRATIIAGSTPTAATIIANAKVADNFNRVVSGFTEPHHRLTSNIGTERLEDGSTITDHVVALPARLTLNGHVSDVSSPEGAGASASAWAALRDAHRSETALVVITEWASYRNMVIRSIDTTQTMRGMQFTIEMQEVVLVGTRSYIPTPRSRTAKDRDPIVQGGRRPIGYTFTDADGIVRFNQFVGPGAGTDGGSSVTLPGRVVTDADGNIQLVPE